MNPLCMVCHRVPAVEKVAGSGRSKVWKCRTCLEKKHEGGFRNTTKARRNTPAVKSGPIRAAIIAAMEAKPDEFLSADQVAAMPQLADYDMQAVSIELAGLHRNGTANRCKITRPAGQRRQGQHSEVWVYRLYSVPQRGERPALADPAAKALARPPRTKTAQPEVAQNTGSDALATSSMVVPAEGVAVEPTRRVDYPIGQRAECNETTPSCAIPASAESRPDNAEPGEQIDGQGLGPVATHEGGDDMRAYAKRLAQERDEAFEHIAKLVTEVDHVMKGRDELARQLSAALDEIETLKAGVAGAEARVEELMGQREIVAGAITIEIASIGDRSHITIKKG